MNNKFKYLRSFLIFDQEDSRFREGTDPSGYVKIEVREGRGKLFCQVSNLKEDIKTNYKLYMIRADDSELVAICAGTIPLLKNRGELKWAFNPCNVDGSGLTIEDFNIAAVLAENYNERFGNVLCPLVSYKENKIEWRQKMRKFLNSRRIHKDETSEKISSDKITNGNKDITDEETIIKYKNIIESKYTETLSKVDNRGESTGCCDNKVENENTDRVEEYNDQAMIEAQSIQDQNTKERNIENPNEQDQNMGKGRTDSQNVQDYNVKAQNINEENLNSANYRDHTGCIDYFTKDIEQNNNKPGAVGYKPGVREFKVSFDKYFEKYNPFRGGRKEYKWWKVSSPVHLNNILYQMDIKIPILFNPMVLMAHFKHRHLIVGTYEDGTRDLSYIVCGVPGVYWVDEKPFGNMCRWAQVEGSVPKYGAFGYWLVYINTKTGGILNMK